jgi:hypothetical protein
LDALPGAVHEYQAGDFRIRQDHPSDLIPCLQQLPATLSNRADIQNYLLQKGFSEKVASWVVTNLRPAGPSRYLIEESFCCKLRDALVLSRLANVDIGLGQNK